MSTDHCSSSLCQGTITANGPGLGPARRFCECACEGCVIAYEGRTILVAVPKPASTIRTRKPLRQVNSRRRRRALAEDFGDLAAVVRTLPCCVAGCTQGPSDPAHVRSRGAGHHAWLVDPDTGARAGNITPLCRPHHDEQGRRGIKDFQKTYKLAVRWRLSDGVIFKPIAVGSLASAAALIGRLFEGGLI